MANKINRKGENPQNDQTSQRPDSLLCVYGILKYTVYTFMVCDTCDARF